MQHGGFHVMPTSSCDGARAAPTRAAAGAAIARARARIRHALETAARSVLFRRFVWVFQALRNNPIDSSRPSARYNVP